MTEQELLTRIDERTGVIQRDVCEVKNHLKEINGTINIQQKDIVKLEYGRRANEAEIGHNRKLIVVMWTTCGMILLANLVLNILSNW